MNCDYKCKPNRELSTNHGIVWKRELNFHALQQFCPYHMTFCVLSSKDHGVPIHAHHYKQSSVHQNGMQDVANDYHWSTDLQGQFVSGHTIWALLYAKSRTMVYEMSECEFYAQYGDSVVADNTVKRCPGKRSEAAILCSSSS